MLNVSLNHEAEQQDPLLPMRGLWNELQSFGSTVGSDQDEHESRAAKVNC